MKPRLLVLTSTFPRWQNDTDPPFVYNLSKRLVKKFDVIVHAPHYPDAKIEENISGIQVHRFRYFIEPFEKLAGASGILPTLRHNKLYFTVVPFFLAAQFLSLLLLVRRVRPHVIHAHWLIPQGCISVLIKVFFKTPVVVTAHGADVFGLQGELFTAVKRAILTRVDGVTVVSNSLREALAEISPASPTPHIIPMGVSSAVFTSEKKDASIRELYQISGAFLLYVGRLTEKKGVEYLLEAMPPVLHRFPDTKLLIVGSGEREFELQRLVKARELDKQICFVGSIPNEELPKYYATADIFIGPSIRAKGGDTEGFGLTFVEASMSGCLVIATNIGGIEDIIHDQRTGFLVPEKDPQALAKKIIYVLENKDKIDHIREDSRKRCVEKFDWDIIAEKYARVLLQVL